MPYTPTEEMARTKSAPTLRSAIVRLIVSPKRSTDVPNGITATDVIAVTNTTSGAKKKTQRSAAAGIRSSLPSSLAPSANGCRSPFGPVRVGPIRSWNAASTLRSKYVMYAMPISKTFMITNATMNFSQIGSSIPVPSLAAQPAPIP